MEFHRAKIIACEPHDNYTLWVIFEDGLSGEINLKHLVGKGVFNSWNSIDFFKTASIDKRTDTVSWENDIDLDPYVIRQEIINTKNKKIH